MFDNYPCGSGKLYANCCKPYIKGKKNALTPEALMRSRYTAYATHEIDYIIDTCKDYVKIKRGNIEDWSNNSKWLGFEILSIDTGETTGSVEFKAKYEQGQLVNVHHEKAYFVKEEERWLYASGKIYSVPVTRSDTKQGRNEYCFCGSGKKYKHCCGR
jgi:SEC-C motif-containing protein